MSSNELYAQLREAREQVTNVIAALDDPESETHRDCSKLLARIVETLINTVERSLVIYYRANPFVKLERADGTWVVFDARDVKRIEAALKEYTDDNSIIHLSNGTSIGVLATVQEIGELLESIRI